VSNLPTEPVVAEKAAERLESVAPPTVLITEQEVKLSTAAAVPMPQPKPVRGLVAVLRAVFQRSSEAAQDRPRHYPPLREEFLEEAAMAREMRRL
jgi:hypothetical protein